MAAYNYNTNMKLYNKQEKTKQVLSWMCTEWCKKCN